MSEDSTKADVSTGARVLLRLSFGLVVDEAVARLGSQGVSRNELNMLGRSSGVNAGAFWGDAAPADSRMVDS